MDSITGQDYPALEHIVVDGGSTDGTLEFLKQRTGQIDWLVEGPDAGIADAMNRGLAVATGDLVVFLHADDRFPSPDALAQAVAQVTDLEHIWAFDIMFGDRAPRRRLSPRPFNAWTWFKNPLPHQGVLCPRRLFDTLGPFDVTLCIYMDYDFWLRAYTAGVPLKRVDRLLAVMGDRGISSRLEWPSLMARFAEERVVQQRHARFRPWRWLYGLYWPVYLAYRWSLCLVDSRCRAAPTPTDS
jgi:GT2 family glycosyltransferase